jgi:hypothetical protein
VRLDDHLAIMKVFRGRSARVDEHDDSRTSGAVASPIVVKGGLGGR